MEADVQTSHGCNFPKLTEKMMDRSFLMAKERGTQDIKDRSPRPFELELERKGRYEGSDREKGEKYSSPRSSPIHD